MKTTIESATLHTLGNFCDSRGNLSVVEGGMHIPFNFKRSFWISDIPQREERGAHAHMQCEQFLVAARGSFDVLVDDGQNQKVVTLDKPWEGLYIPAGLWAAERNYSPEAVCIVFASEHYDEADYIRSYERFLEYRKTL